MKENISRKDLIQKIDELETALERYRLAVESTGDGVWDWDLISGKVWFSDRYYTMLGYEPGEFPASYQSWTDRLHPDDKVRAETTVREHIENRQPDFDVDFRLRTKSGRWRWLQGRGRVVERDASGTPVRMTGVHRDIDERKSAEEALKSREAQMTAFAEAFDGIIYTSNRDCRIEYFNKGFRERLGEDAASRPCHEVLFGLSGRCDWCQRDRTFDGETVITEARSPRDGKWYLTVSNPIFGADGRVEKKFTLMLDITDRKEAERAYRDSVQSYRTLAENLPGIVYRIHLRQKGRMQFFNDMLEKMTGFSPDDLECGKICNIDPLIVSEDHDYVFSTVQQAIDTGQPFEVEYRMITRGRGRRHVLERGHPIYGEDGAPLYIDGVILDITERKIAEEKLRESEVRYRSILAAAPDSITITRMRDGRYLQANDFFYQATGYAPEEVIGRTPNDLNLFVRPEERGRLVEMLATYGKVGNFEVQYRRKDGTVIDALLSARRIEYGNEDCLVAVAVDISNRKRAERELLESENTLRAILSASPVGIALVENRSIKWASRSMCRILGYTGEEFLGKSTRFLYIDEAEYQRAGKAIYGGLNGLFKTEVVDAKLVRKSGEPFDGQIVARHVDHNDPSKGHIFTLMDITDQKAAENALIESESRFRSLVENSLVGICIVQGDRIVYQNDEHHCLLSGHVGTGHPIDLTRIHPDDRDQFAGLYESLTTENHHRIETEIRLVSSGDTLGGMETVWAHVRASRIRFCGQTALLFNIMDITRAKQLEQIVRIKDKMTSLGRISAGIAHEIRNPLGGINMYLGVLKTAIESMDGEETATASSAAEVIPKIQAASNRIEKVIRRVMDFAKPTAPQLSRINLNDAVENALALAEVSLRKKGVSVSCNLAAGLPEIYADRAMVEQVLLNMVNNSTQAMESSGGERRLELATYPVSEAVAIEICDSGPGIAEAFREKIFDPFVTTRTDGSGIGLSICRRIVADHQGTITVSDSPWGGAKFSIKIPIEKRMYPR